MRCSKDACVLKNQIKIWHLYDTLLSAAYIPTDF